jgi:hypothetical protein
MVRNGCSFVVSAPMFLFRQVVEVEDVAVVEVDAADAEVVAFPDLKAWSKCVQII